MRVSWPMGPCLQFGKGVVELKREAHGKASAVAVNTHVEWAVVVSDGYHIFVEIRNRAAASYSVFGHSSGE